MPLVDRNERILSATSTRPSRQHSAFGSSLPPSNKQSSVSTTQLTNASRQPASRPGSARPTSADLLHGRGKTVMYEQLARATTARPSSGRATGRAVATFTPTNRYVDQAAAGSLRARAGVDGGVDSGVSVGSSASAHTTRYRPPVVVSNATLRERDWNNPNSPASRVKSSSGVVRSRPETAPIASIRTPVNMHTRAVIAPSSTASTARVQSALEKLAVSNPVVHAVTDEPRGSPPPRRESRFDIRRDDEEPETLADIVAASVPPAVRTTPAPPHRTIRTGPAGRELRGIRGDRAEVGQSGGFRSFTRISFRRNIGTDGVTDGPIVRSANGTALLRRGEARDGHRVRQRALPAPGV